MIVISALVSKITIISLQIEFCASHSHCVTSKSSSTRVATLSSVVVVACVTSTCERARDETARPMLWLSTSKTGRKAEKKGSPSLTVFVSWGRVSLSSWMKTSQSVLVLTLV